VKLVQNNPPLYFVPTAILCVCGQRVLVNDPSTHMSVTVMCTNPNCSQYNLDKKIDLTKFAFTEYEVL
jgi:hypothetical protein